ncbi:spore germination protein [Paenibacillus alginolyticus]|uniref:GerAB/ArcD/ProY family transporter n=1 Tax=Paenibacillus alginolyticus TaxID=59839 RepID=UPI000400CDBF|nr:GerAB/ArcD/ProY family transporter [Paenibacillus alginolyticus]MCY9667311.1 spore germination protein [Paenibacillus alginolyticus]
MNAEKDSITKKQLAFFTIQTAIGEGALTVPYSVHSEASIDGWISMLLAGFATHLVIILIWMICRKYPKMTMIEFLPQMAGKFAGHLISVLYIIYFIGIASVILMNYCRIINAWIFPSTPKWVIMSLMMATSYYLAKERLKIIVRFETLVSILIIIIIFLIIFPFSKGNPLYIFPIGQSGIGPMIRGMREAVVTLAGFELLLMVYPQVKGKDKDILKTMLISYTFVTLFYVLIILSCFMFFSPEELSIIPEPVLYMLKAFSFRIVERSDLLFLSLWVVIVMTSIVNYVFLASTGITQILKTGNSSKVTLLVIAACLLIALLPHNFLFISKLNKWFSYFALVMIYLLPIPLLLLTILRGRRKATE